MATVETKEETTEVTDAAPVPAEEAPEVKAEPVVEEWGLMGKGLQEACWEWRRKARDSLSPRQGTIIAKTETRRLKSTISNRPRSNFRSSLGEHGLP
ncbi:hypothetical protein LOK49_LG09G00105 [Camellia lanceoleosa]|uniref:Uncharacterized protein n=1 Tax=Camellia lanceoleosa TaxID=1840588 RepID=A0ACC0GIL2_9ERIC|nr:hypothetical protein LOK49_LG09G00105 [Camellia lanceoleosa]